MTYECSRPRRARPDTVLTRFAVDRMRNAERPVKQEADVLAVAVGTAVDAQTMVLAPFAAR